MLTTKTDRELQRQIHQRGWNPRPSPRRKQRARALNHFNSLTIENSRAVSLLESISFLFSVPMFRRRSFGEKTISGGLWSKQGGRSGMTDFEKRTDTVGIYASSFFHDRNRVSFFGHTARVAFLLSTLALGACSHVEAKQHKVEAEFREVQTQSRGGSQGLLYTPVVSKSDKSDIQGGRAVEDYKSKQDLKTIRFDNPFRLSFVSVSVDQLMRRLTDYTSMEWLAEENITIDTVISIDVVIRTSDDVYDLVDAMATLMGVPVEWTGTRAVFLKTTTAALSPVQSYFIRTQQVAPEVAEIVRTRFKVDCQPVRKFTVCVGKNKDVEKAETFLRVVEGNYGKVVWRLIEAEYDLAAVTVTLGLESEIVATKVQDDTWLVASNDERFLDLVSDVAKNIVSDECRLTTYEPRFNEPDNIADTLTIAFPEICTKPTASGDLVVWSAKPLDTQDMHSLALQMDKEKPLAKIKLIIATDTDIRRMGLAVEGWDGLIPTNNPPRSLELLGALTRASGWRSLEMTTDGRSTASIQQTDRVDGNVVVTDGGSQISGVENRTVGLSVSVNGVVTGDGYRGQIDVSDSTLDGDVTLSANCGSYIAIGIGEVVKVCSYLRDQSGLSVRILSLDKADNQEEFNVYAVLMTHEKASLDTLRIVTGTG